MGNDSYSTVRVSQETKARLDKAMSDLVQLYMPAIHHEFPPLTVYDDPSYDQVIDCVLLVWERYVKHKKEGGR